jgi:hypothetical protein
VYVGILFEPIQACIDMHRRAWEIGMQIGNVALVTLHKHSLIVRSLHAGTNLMTVNEEIERELKMARHYSFPHIWTKLSYYQETVLTLIGDESTSVHPQLDDTGYDALLFEHQMSYFFSRVIMSTYLGYWDRVKRMAEKWESLRGVNNKLINLRSVYMSVFHGLALIALRRRKNSKKLPDINRFLAVVSNAASCSEWNFENKASLLKAEMLSFCCENSKAEVEYDAAITSARSSKFIHEEGLACELAGMHSERLNSTEKALIFFHEAERCYKDWGSKRKANQMAEKIQQISQTRVSD